MNYTTVTNPHWADEKNTMIDADVNFEEHGVIPFTASPSDPEAHGVEIYNRCMDGDFGEIAPYTPPVISQQMEDDIKLAELNASITPVRLAEAVLTKEGRTWLEDVTEKIKKLESKK